MTETSYPTVEGTTTEYGFITRIKLVKEPTAFQMEFCNSAGIACEFVKKLLGDSIDIFESFYALYLNRANQIIDYARISQGGIAGTTVDSKLILKYGIETLSSGIILAHNHPSGNINPSVADKDLTHKIQKQLQFFDIMMLDHVIVSREKYYSFADHGILMQTP